jgi:hypothetical protein
MNYNRMTIRENGEAFAVFKMKRQTLGYATDMAANRAIYTVSAIAKPQFVGTYSACLDFIREAGAEFMTEHGIPV